MSSAVPTLRSRFSQCVRESCETSNCKLNLNAFPSEKIILDIDCIAEKNPSHVQGERCDYIIVVRKNGRVFLLPVEVKTKRVIPDKVKTQLEGGIRFLRTITEINLRVVRYWSLKGSDPQLVKSFRKFR